MHSWLHALKSRSRLKSPATPTQSTERAVKLTMETAAAVMHADRQDSYALNKRAFHQRCPGQVTKATFIQVTYVGNFKGVR